ncbi:MAG TPA: fumarylacetoacetase [Pseudonocardiaceae bacterium]
MSWIDSAIGDGAFAADRPFGPQTLPYGVFSAGPGEPGSFRAVGVRVGDHVLDVSALAAVGSLPHPELLSGGSLDPLLAAGRPQWTALREAVTELVLSSRRPPDAVLYPVAEVRTYLPFTVRDYVDFYSSRHHAENVGRIFRPNDEPLLPNWTHLPVGYHGRAGTVVVSGTSVMRPCGQMRPPSAGTSAGSSAAPVFGPSRRLDIEAEVSFVCGGPARCCVPVDEVAEHVFGVALLNDWSARDIQSWEYQPLGPFLAKSFATSLAAWITPLDALQAARIPAAGPSSDAALLPYLRTAEPWGLDLSLTITWNGTVVSRPPFATMAYSCAQQLAHMTVNGATVRPGDLFASGTVSGPSRDERGCFLELTWDGREPVTLDNGSTRTFLEDRDTVVITAVAPGPDGSVVGFGEVAGRVLPARLPG